MFNNFMLDLETLSLEPNATILQIACIPFEWNQDCQQSINFNVHIDNNMDYEAGGHISHDTQEFWAHKDLIETKELLTQDQIDPHEALCMFSQWFQMHKNHNAKVWTLGNMDSVWLTQMYKRHKLHSPIQFRSWMDMRTLNELSGGVAPVENYEPPHYALSDCKGQIDYAINCYRQLKGL